WKCHGVDRAEPSGEAPFLMRAPIAEGEDLVAAAKERNVLAVDAHERDLSGRQRRQLQHLHARHATGQLFPPYASSSTSTMCRTSTGAPGARSPWTIWMMQPGLGVTTTSAPVSLMCAIFRRCSRCAISG